MGKFIKTCLVWCILFLVCIFILLFVTTDKLILNQGKQINELEEINGNLINVLNELEEKRINSISYKVRKAFKVKN